MLKSKIRSVATRFSDVSRRRARLALENMRPEANWRILDLGGGTGHRIKSIFPDHRHIVVCDPVEDNLAIARSLGFETVCSDGANELPFADKEFDLVFCSGVIEHVTGPKQDLLRRRSSVDFVNEAWRHQFKFAQEIRRIAKRFFVQTPHKYFIVESHTWLPLPIVLIPRALQIDVLGVANRFGIRKSFPDWNLLVPREMRQLFPDATIIVEKRFKLPKSIMAIQS